MSAPELPEIFGNYVLGEAFVEVTAPAAVSWLPQTAGWAWLGVALGLLLLRLGWRRLRRWYRDRYRREARARLRALGAEPDERWLAELNRLLKLTALAGYSREQVARLCGRDWVRFLNACCPQAPFSAAQCELLSSGVYLRAVPEREQAGALLQASLDWVAQHEAPADA